MFWLSAYQHTGSREDIAGEPPTIAYKGGAEWLVENTPAGSTVFHTDWDDFPKLFFYNTHNTYIVGLDPDFMRLKHERLFHQYEDITRGRVPDMEDIILNEFGCEYVFTDNEHRDFITSRISSRAESVFDGTHVYRILASSRNSVAVLDAQGMSF